MNERLKQEYESWVENDPVYSKMVNNIVGKAVAEHFYNLALEDVKQSVNETIGILKKQNPNPLGTITECLADAEIAALETVICEIEKLIK